MTGKIRLAAATGLLIVLLAGCQTDPSDGVVRTNEPSKGDVTSFGDTFDGLKTVSDVDYYASDQAVTEAKTQFRSENYGNAGALFYKATRLAPNDGVAWLGLAASCDRIRRFDLADIAYARAYRLLGATPEYYNNVGYSYLLRGKLQDARTNFLKAYELAPNDPTVANNLKLLSSSVRNIERS
ncbi:tetratricopeptide repeat protein [Mesorhizobium sp. B3-1-3]|uniref:tetratricopeptide repeat protein n=1 Tax=unclassified Mesorhizobium TaxID=325217 RepID=UPI00112860E4|nr:MULTISPECIES: tetratricopeptide repeat protein [unclassified Mesorhizobium]TPI54086.1 tetratricopeptide repeat protein [Mesorhizobium sp. B3-1-8]TPI61270.1 tetratricopeptide repeat protein [Mesorhizobium sp. B3-1-3]